MILAIRLPDAMIARKAPLFLLPALLLAACEQPQQASDEDAPPATDPVADASGAGAAEDSGESGGGDEFALTETGWLTIGSDGSVQTTFFDANGRYRDLVNGELVAEGGWQRRPDGTLCFEPDAGRGACWETGQPDENGTAIATDGDGKRIEIRRVTYIPLEDEE